MAKKLKDARLKTEARRDRHDDNREVAQDRVLNDQQRLDEFRQQFFQSVLPDLPKIPGYHNIWLTTSNSHDSIARRVRLGYEPIKASDVPGYEALSMKTGEYAGCIGINEMVAFKIPSHLYEMYMSEAHHTQPLLEEEKLKSMIETIREESSRSAASGGKGIKVEAYGGMEELGVDPGVPSFSEEH